ncbi:MAG: YtxH domain-containing protein [Bacillota bacterium]
MRTGFWTGMLAGGLVGAFVGMMVLPQMQPETRQRFAHAGKSWKHRAERAVRRARSRAEDMVEEMQ